MKIGFVTPWYGEFAGGAEKEIRGLAEHFLKSGQEVVILTTCCRSPFENWWKNGIKEGDYRIKGVPVKRFPVDSGNEEKYHELNSKLIHQIPLSSEEEVEFLKCSINSSALVRYLCENSTDFVYLLSPYLFGLTYHSYRSVPDRCILIPCLHDEPQAYFKPIVEMLEICPLIFYSEEEMQLAKRICRTPENRRRVLGGGVNVPSNVSNERFRLKYGISHDYILYVGRKDLGKNVKSLITWFIDYRSTYGTNIDLIFLGGGDSSLLPDRSDIIDLGFIEEQDKFDAYAGAVATCLLSNNESFSLVMMESWLAGTPVIVSDFCPVTKGHCIRSNGGLFVKDSEEFVEALHFITSNREKMKLMGMNGKKYVENRYTWEMVVPKFLETINCFIG
jgi:glycosyltransferase involved in cell wall biosynthesis